MRQFCASSALSESHFYCSPRNSSVRVATCHTKPSHGQRPTPARSLGRHGEDLGCKVTVVGANNDIGRPLSLLLKMNRLISELALYDSYDADSLMNDLNQVNTYVAARSYTGKEQLEASLLGAHLVLLIQVGAHQGLP